MDRKMLNLQKKFCGRNSKCFHYARFYENIVRHLTQDGVAQLVSQLKDGVVPFVNAIQQRITPNVLEVVGGVINDVVALLVKLRNQGRRQVNERPPQAGLLRSTFA